MQFKLIDLVWVTAYLAVGAWLYSSGYALFIAIWFGTVFGFEIGKRSDYSTPLLAMCGSVLGLAISVAIMCSSTFTHGKLFMFGKIDVLQVILSAAAWLTALGIFVWLATRLKKSPVRRA